MNEDIAAHEALVKQLNNGDLRGAYALRYDHYRPGVVPSLLGWLMVASGDLVYGRRPSYGKFKAIEVIARIPYQSWEVAAYTLLTAFYGDEARAIRLARFGAFSRIAQDNETMHVVVISQLCKKYRCVGFFRHTLIPLFFSLFYFWTIYLLYMLAPRAALELNYIFEEHAYRQYEEFIESKEEHLKQEPICSDFLAFYGREVRSEYEFFELVRNDELVHRNRSIREVEARMRA